MEVVKRKSYINKVIKYIQVRECNYNDIIDENLKYSKKYHESILMKKLKVDWSTEKHSKSSIVRSMVMNIFFHMMRVIVRELLSGNTIQLKHIGTLVLETNSFNTKYRGKREDYLRAKNKGQYTMIKCTYNNKNKKFEYGMPYWSFGLHYKHKLWKKEDNGYKF